MKSRLWITMTVMIVQLLAGCSAPAERPEGGPAGDSASETGPAATAQSMLARLETKIKIAEDKFIQLAEAVPEDRYDWRPMEGVRSFREVFIHIAADNWAPIWIGVSIPEDVPVTTDMATFSAYQAQRLTREQSVVELKRSFDFLLASLDQSRNRLGERVMFGEREWAMEELWVALVTHMHEHLGQTIAYARANGIVPPWNR